MLLDTYLQHPAIIIAVNPKENDLDKNFRLVPTHVKKNESSYEKLMPS